MGGVYGWEEILFIESYTSMRKQHQTKRNTATFNNTGDFTDIREWKKQTERIHTAGFYAKLISGAKVQNNG